MSQTHTTNIAKPTTAPNTTQPGKLVFSPEMPQRSEPSQDLSPHEVVGLESLVSLHMGMGCEQALVQHFTTQSLMATPSGSLGPVKPMESLALPELDTPK